MKQIHIRRFLSLLLAALTLWAAAVTAGSDSAAAALQQLRQGSRLPQQALRWELGDFFGLDSLSAVTVMTLAQSPLLLAGRSTVAALLSAGVTRDPPEPAAPESPNTPSPSADPSLTDGLTFADNGVPAQTTAPTSSKMDPVHIFPINRDKENAVISRLFSMFSINLVQAKSSKNKGF